MTTPEGHYLKELNVAFSLFDKESEGFISREQLMLIIQAEGKNPTDKEVNHILQDVGLDKMIEKISYQNFLKIMGHTMLNEVGNAVIIDNSFQVFIDHHGNMPVERFKSLMGNAFDRLTEEDIERCLEDMPLKVEKELFVFIPDDFEGQEKPETEIIDGREMVRKEYLCIDYEKTSMYNSLKTKF